MQEAFATPRVQRALQALERWAGRLRVRVAGRLTMAALAPAISAPFPRSNIGSPSLNQALPSAASCTARGGGVCGMVACKVRSCGLFEEGCREGCVVRSAAIFAPRMVHETGTRAGLYLRLFRFARSHIPSSPVECNTQSRATCDGAAMPRLCTASAFTSADDATARYGGAARAPCMMGWAPPAPAAH